MAIPLVLVLLPLGLLFLLSGLVVNTVQVTSGDPGLAIVSCNFCDPYLGIVR